MRVLLLLVAPVLGASCATSPTRLAVANTSPQRGSGIREEAVLRVEVAYAVDGPTPNQGIAARFKTRGGGNWEAARQVVKEPQGRVTFEIPGADLFRNAALVRPYQVRFVLDERERSGSAQTLKETPVIYFDRAYPPVEPSSDAEELNARAVAPRVGKGQLLTDMVNDRSYRPQLPPSLNKAGAVVWGLYKICVDSDGDVYHVRIIKSAHAEVDPDWLAILRRLKHRPYTIEDEPVPYCYPMRLEVRSSY